MSARWPALAALTVLAASGCGTAGPEPSDDADGPSVSASVVQYRRDVVPRRVQVKVENAGEATVVVDRVLLASPLFTPMEPVPQDAELAPGQRVDLRVPLGEPVCSSDAADVAEGPRVEVWTDGHDDPVVLEPVVADVLGEIRDLECAEQEAQEVVDVAFGTTWTRVGSGDGLEVAGTLAVRSLQPDVAATVTAVGTTTLFVPAVDGLPVTTAVPSDLAVRFGPARCDGHAVGEAHRGYRFGVRVTVEGRDPVIVYISPDDAGRAVLQQALLERCGLSTLPTTP